MRKVLVIAAALLALAACSRPQPPQGRWEGAYDSGGTLVAARVEIEPNGQVRLSAPDLTGADAVDADQHEQMRDHVAAELANGWDNVAPRPMDYDGETFRKPGGIAPQMIWDKDKHQMTLVLYLGNAPVIYIPLQSVGAFRDNPWPSG
ncbi:MAG TPA: hypothetical protein VIJ72_01525 [Rhizomicrobium sp.]